MAELLNCGIASEDLAEQWDVKGHDMFDVADKDVADHAKMWYCPQRYGRA